LQTNSRIQPAASRPPPAAEPSAAPALPGVYTHVPFCARTCDFCAFYQEQPERGRIEGYLEGIRRELELVPYAGPVDSFFWGGGTPGLLAPKHLSELGEAMLQRFGPPRREWTVEMAPGSVREEKLEVLRQLGVTRVSMGVQSFQPELLEALGRPHAVEKAYAAYDQIRAAGFPQVNLDLIFAIPGQSPEQWAADLREAIRLQPDHLSTYCLTFEEDTALYVKLSQGKVSIDPERERRYFQLSWDLLGEAGYQQYEISNYAQPGAQCIHNMNTWRMGEWLGLGPAAAGQFGGWRGSNPADLTQWLADLAAGRRATADLTQLTPGLLAEDAVIFGLRLNEGIDLSTIASRFPQADLSPAREALAAWAAEGLAELSVDGNRARLTAEGRLVADGIGTELVGTIAELP
jgi:oxygen-independent coproporphyrinogen III oxidase